MDVRLTEEKPLAGIQLQFLPGFTRFIFQKRLDDFSEKLKMVYQHDDVPALKEIWSLTNTDKSNHFNEYCSRLLGYLMVGDHNSFINEEVRSWLKVGFSIISPANEYVNDIIAFCYLRKKQFLSMAAEYTDDLQVANGIADELDQINSQEMKILINHFFHLQQNLYKQAQSLAHIGNWIWDIQTNRITWSDEIYSIYNIPLFTPLTFNQVIAYCHPDDREHVAYDIQSSSQANTPFDLYFRIITHGGEEKIIHAMGHVVESVDNKPVKMFGTLQDVTKQKLAEIELVDNRNLIRKIADVTPSLIALYNLETGKYIFVNQAITSLLGYSVHEVLENDIRFFAEKIHPDDLGPVMEKNNRAIELANQQDAGEAEKVTEFRYRIKNKNGAYRWLDTYGTVFSRTADGKVETILNISVDVTEQLELKKKVEDEKNFADLLVENSPDMVMALDEEMRIKVWNRFCEVHNNKAKSEVIGRILFEVFPEYDNEKWRSDFKSVLSGESRHYPKIRFKYKEGYGEVFLIPYRNSYNKIKGVLSICRDITDVVESTAQLEQQNEIVRRSEEKYHNMVEEVQDYAMILLTIDGTIENWNKGAEKIKGYKAEEIVGKSFRIFYSKEDQKNERPERLLREAMNHGRASDEGWRIRKDGTKFWGFTVITALHNKENHVIGFSKVTRDLTLKKLAEDQLRKHAITMEQKNIELQKSNKELESFSYVASHDLQEPLRKIQAFSNRILEKERHSLSDSGKDMFGRIQSAASRMQELIDALLNFSRTNTAPRIFEITDMNILLQEVCSNLKETIDEKQAKIEIDRMPMMRVIPFQIQQVFTNLINNSLKYSKQGVRPEIKVTVDALNGSEIDETPAEKDLKYYAIAVKDNGIGFDQKYSTKVFELFQRLHGRNEYSGTGIGLSICKKIAENHHGFMTAAGVQDKGATFTLYIPVIQDQL